VRARVRAYGNGIFVLAEGPDLPDEGLFLCVGNYAIRQLVLREKNFGRLAFWEWHPDVLGSLLSMASATLGRGITLAEDLCFTAEEKHGKPQGTHWSPSQPRARENVVRAHEDDGVHIILVNRSKNT
jgi:hypothetical protein